MFPYVKVSKQGIKLILGSYVIIVLQHIYRQALAETAGTDEEEKLVRIFYYGDKPGLVHIITVIAADNGEVHHAVGDASSVRGYVFFFHDLCLFRGLL